MFSMTKNRELDEVQTSFYFVNRRHYGEDVKSYPTNPMCMYGKIAH